MFLSSIIIILINNIRWLLLKFKVGNLRCHNNFYQKKGGIPFGLFLSSRDFKCLIDGVLKKINSVQFLLNKIVETNQKNNYLIYKKTQNY